MEAAICGDKNAASTRSLDIKCNVEDSSDMMTALGLSIAVVYLINGYTMCGVHIPAVKKLLPGLVHGLILLRLE